ncbi:MAG: hypothetical protein GF411_19465 [Candidatus Lokiarchaeota archaeon]|nr:hypothetical protein [Candidatus Lokiarchaeota archaeon]
MDNSRVTEDTKMELEHIEGETFIQLIHRIGLEKKDLGDCFRNGNLVKDDEVLDDGDRIGLFPFNMVLLCGGQHLKGHGYTQSEKDVDYY